MAKITYNERPIYTGRTSRWSLGVDFVVIAIIVCALIFLVFAPTLILSLLVPEFIAKLMQNSPDLLLIVIMAACVLFISGIVAVQVLSVSNRQRMTLIWSTFFMLILMIALLVGVVILIISQYGTAKFTFVNAPGTAITHLVIISAVFTAYSFLTALSAYWGVLRRISTAFDDGRRGNPNNARNVVNDMVNHNTMRYVTFKVYKNQIVVNDFNGWREWVYLIAGIYHVRIRQTWFGKSFNYGDVIIRSTGTAGQIVFPGIKKPHELKAILQKQIQTGSVGVGGFIPQDING